MNIRPTQAGIKEQSDSENEVEFAKHVKLGQIA
jgi:hypothetical protein